MFVVSIMSVVQKDIVEGIFQEQNLIYITYCL